MGRRKHRKKAFTAWVCEVKEFYASYHEAHEALQKIHGRRGSKHRLSSHPRKARVKLAAYRCPFCNRWHLGHANSRAAQRQKQSREGRPIRPPPDEAE